MTVLGESSKPTYSYFAYDGTVNPNQVAELLVAPARIEIVTLGAWIGGWNDTVHAKLQVWDAATHAVLGTTAEIVVANNGAASGDVDRYEEDLVTPVIIEEGTDFWVGITKDRDDAAQWATGTNINAHYEGRGAYTDSTNLGAVSGTSVARRTGMYVADYTTVAQAWVYRTGVWLNTGGVKVRRSGAWADANGVKIYRSGTWVDAS